MKTVSLAGMLAAVGLALCSLLGRAAPEEFKIDPGHTFSVFEIRHLGVSTQRGRFDRTSGTVSLDPQAGAGHVDIVIDARSVNTGHDALDKLLRSEDFFNVEQFPEISYRAHSIAYAEGKPERIEGELTLRGISKSVPLTVLGYGCTRKPFLVQLRCGIDAVATIRRSEFAMTSLIAFTSDEVKLVIQAEGLQLDRQAASLE